MKPSCLLPFAFAALALGSQDAYSQGDTFESRLGIHGRWAAEIRSVQDGSIASGMGFSPGDLIVLVDGRPMRDFSSFGEFLGAIRESLKSDHLTLGVSRYDSSTLSYAPPKSISPPARKSGSPPVEMLGIQSTLTFVVDEVSPGRPADRMGIHAGETFLTLNGRGIGSLQGPAEADEILTRIHGSPDKEVNAVLLRGVARDHAVKPEAETRKVRGPLF
ncbi:MAG TPA: hypothetical protein VFW45_05725 [Candidatus Polarisedimenticolia bacterium]|nr:hypothetical protein [Candidatus Polarisedimenticolia bacterium]